MSQTNGICRAENVILDLLEPAVLLPTPEWITDSRQQFYFFVSEAEKLKKEFINNLKV